ncbi:unnamed protein product, partial [Laminaria digitata]
MPNTLPQLPQVYSNHYLCKFATSQSSDKATPYSNSAVTPRDPLARANDPLEQHRNERDGEHQVCTSRAKIKEKKAGGSTIMARFFATSRASVESSAAAAAPPSSSSSSNGSSSSSSSNSNPKDAFRATTNSKTESNA